MKALVIANSTLPSNKILKACKDDCTHIVCADGGANRALEQNLTADFVVGDFDSMSEETRRKFSQAELVHRESQNETDLEKTLEFIFTKGFSQAILIGITGLRLDHQIVNLNIAEKYCGRLELEIHDDFGVGGFICAQQDPVHKTFESFPGQQVSLIAFRRTYGITTQNLKYPLNDESLEWGVRDGLSNEATSNQVLINIRSGNLFCYFVRQEVGVP